MKPQLLDLFCGAGGCSVGYARAGFDVVGVDIRPQPRYPFEFIQADALEFVEKRGREFDAIHASPPCQAYSVLKSVCRGREYPDLIEPARQALEATGKPWVIENVVGAPMGSSIFLCGTMFKGLRVYRHRHFESSFWMWQPEHPKHLIRSNSKGQNRKARYMAGGFVTVCGDVGTYCSEAMGIDWMIGTELSQAIPPAYTEFIGKQLISYVKE